jgi:hypothetical protein
MSVPEYDPSAANQHAQHLFNEWQDGPLSELYAWLSEKNIDANVTPHAEVKRVWRAEQDAAVADADATPPAQFPEVADHLKEG